MKQLPKESLVCGTRCTCEGKPNPDVLYCIKHPKRKRTKKQKILKQCEQERVLCMMCKKACTMIVLVMDEKRNFRNALI